jgi:hypothetical protein
VKTCIKCLNLLPLTDFYRRKAEKDGLHYYCKKCLTSIDQTRKDKLKSIKAEWYQRNRESVLTKTKSWNTKNSDQRQKNVRTWVKENRLESLRKKRLRYAEDLNFKLADNLRSRLSKTLRRNGSAVRDLGCTLDELKVHLESKFQLGMTWDNWSRDGWHIDHIRPLSSFDLTDAAQFIAAVHYTNLQPLWATENRKKGAR